MKNLIDILKKKDSCYFYRISGHEGFTRVRAVKALRRVQQGELQGGGVQGLGDVGRRGEW